MVDSQVCWEVFQSHYKAIVKNTEQRKTEQSHLLVYFVILTQQHNRNNITQTSYNTTLEYIVELKNGYNTSEVFDMFCKDIEKETNGYYIGHSIWGDILII